MSLDELGEAAKGFGRRRLWAAGGARIALAVLLFSLGLICGVPLAMFSVELIMDNALAIFAAMFGVLLLAAALTTVIIAFRRPLLRTVVRRSEIELERFARPLADVARFAAEQKVQEATDAAREVGELMLARFAWVSTRRWMVATITAFVAAIAALSGSVLLLQQNQLLQQQTERIVEQNALLGHQIELGEAQRSTSIVPEILAIGEAIGEETATLAKDGRPGNIFRDDELSPGLRARIIAASVAARPYRYLESGLTRASDTELSALALDRRPDLTDATAAIARWRAQSAKIDTLTPDVAGERLIDRPASPERGQILSLLYNLGIMSTQYLTFYGADFSFADLKLASFGIMSLRHASLRFADFSGTPVRSGEFGAAFLEQARFRRSTIAGSHFSGLEAGELVPPFMSDSSLPLWRTQMAGIDFAGATITDSDFRRVDAVGARFDYALLQNVDFTEATLSGSTFRDTVLGSVIFTGADLRSVDFDGAFVFSADILDKLAAEAAPGSFKPDRYRLVPSTEAELAAEASSVSLGAIPFYPDRVPGIWRIVK